MERRYLWTKLDVKRKKTMKKTYNTPEISIVTIGSLMFDPNKDRDNSGMLRASRFQIGSSGSQMFIEDDDEEGEIIIPASDINLLDTDEDW